MDSYNDDWCQCPICLENYSVEHRPTTFVCGHSICIDHVQGRNKLEECPVCRYSLKSSNEYHVSYSLEEAVRVFNALKKSIYWDKLMKKEEKVEIVNMKIKPIEKPNDSYEEELQRKERLLDEMNSTVNNYFSHPFHMKSCGHNCHTSSSNMCCACSTKQERLIRNTTTLKRNKISCSICKKRS